MQTRRDQATCDLSWKEYLWFCNIFCFCDASYIVSIQALLCVPFNVQWWYALILYVSLSWRKEGGDLNNDSKDLKLKIAKKEKN